MKKMATLLFFSVCLLMSSTPYTASTVNADSGRTKALWVWDFYEAAADSNKITQLLSFLKDHEINLLFIGTRRTLPDQPAAYEELIRRAHASGIRVFALVGRANWALETHHREALEELRQVLLFNTSHPSTKFDGIQYDIEPHTLPEYKSRRGSVSYQFIQVLKKIANQIALHDKNLEFNAAIPWWYATGENPVIVETGGEKKPLSYFVIDIVDTVSIMAYRNTADRQIRATQAEIDYAANRGKKVYIGAETNPPNGGSIPNEITYYHGGRDYMNQQLRTVSSYFADHFGFGGIAIHDYPAYKEMIRKSR